MRFDLSSFKHKIVKAVLQFKMKESAYQWKELATNEKKTCASGLYIATADWFGGSYDQVVPGELYVQLPNLLPEQSMFASDDGKVKVKDNQSFQIDVTPVVQDWLDNKRPNFGFMLVGPNEATEKSTDYWTSTYGPFQLSLTYQEISF